MIFLLYAYLLCLFGSLIGFEPEAIEKLFESALLTPQEIQKFKFDYSQDNPLFEKAICQVQAHMVNEPELAPWKTLYTVWYVDLRNKYHIESKFYSSPQNIN